MRWVLTLEIPRYFASFGPPFWNISSKMYSKYLMDKILRKIMLAFCRRLGSGRKSDEVRVPYNEILKICIIRLYIYIYIYVYIYIWTPSKLEYKPHLSRQYNCWSLRCSWSIACRRCSFWTYQLASLDCVKTKCMVRREAFKLWDFVWLMLEIWR